ncbi:hypothetical protein BH10ACI1_BH10ACI1_19050 [soil metagenome]
MSYETSVEEAEATAEKGFQCAEFIFLFMKNRWENSLEHIKPENLREIILISLWQRAYCWLQTLARLNGDAYFQAIATASRALLEIYVDMVLIHFDTTNEKSDKLFWWYNSEKLKAFELQIKYELENNLPNDPSLLDFINENKAKIENNRLRVWGVKKHPKFNRWTNNTLNLDVKEVDELCHAEIKKFLGRSLQHHYETEYRRVNWDIHSGITSVYGYREQKFSLNNFGYFWDSSNFGILCTRLILTEFRFAQVIPNYEQEFEQLQVKQNKFLPLPCIK